MVRMLALFILATGLFAAPASADEIDCAGLSAVPDGWTYGADRDGNAMIFAQSGEVIWCDGQGRSLARPPSNAVLGVATGSASPFVAPFALVGTWTMAGSVEMPSTASALVGYLGSSADLRFVFWRSSVGGPIEVWVLGLTE